MHHVPQTGLTALAVAGPVERVVRPHRRTRLAGHGFDAARSLTDREERERGLAVLRKAAAPDRACRARRRGATENSQILSVAGEAQWRWNCLGLPKSLAADATAPGKPHGACTLRLLVPRARQCQRRRHCPWLESDSRPLLHSPAHAWSERIQCLAAEHGACELWRANRGQRCAALGVCVWPNVRVNLPAEAGTVSPVRDDAPRAADRACGACRSGSG